MGSFGLVLISVLLVGGGATTVNGGILISKEEGLFPLTVIHLNDFHARFEETNVLSTKCKPQEGERCIGGYGRVVSAVKDLSEAYKEQNPIYLNAGDNFQGTFWYTLLRWNVTSYFLNLLPADAITLGNHEFDHGIDGVVPFMGAIKSPVVVANLDDSGEPRIQGKYNKSVVIRRGGVRIGVIGVIHHATNTLSMTERLVFLDEVEAINTEVAQLRASGVNIIVVLSHCGIDIDKKIAAECADVDIVVGGHSHTFLYNGSTEGFPDPPAGPYPVVVKRPDGNKALVVQASCFTKFIGRLTAYFDSEGKLVEWEGNPVFLDESIPLDPQIVQELKPWKEMVDQLAYRNVGSSRVVLSKRECRTGECNLGSFVADSFVDYYVRRSESSNEWTYASIGITNDGGMRTSLNSGNLTYDDLVTTVPYENTIDTFEIQGLHLLEALEYSASRFNTADFLQLSGLRIVYNVTKPIGRRVASVHVRCRECKVPKYQPIDTSKLYRVAIAAWIGNGGNGYTMFKQHRVNVRVGPLDIVVLEQYVKKMSPIMQGIDGRIRILK
ncbi:apyrase-like [Toxorhynchites rutilus septentrionalis]|uniref:apyrase-like n=1 Tax=Toxorhynchites rutilus septentrionalis TaxID=329112 RepID=UPI002478D7CC|nr:apyrase-like [Toxorhynchites rutilus septentrionalis]